MKNDAVERWFGENDNPQKELMLYLREFILRADSRITESIKWQAPTFEYKGNIASFNPRSKKHASLMFHEGANIPGEFPHLEGTGKVARSMKFPSQDEARELESELTSVMRAWCDMKDAE